MSSRKFQKASMVSPSFAEKLGSIMESKETEELQIFAVTAWNIWKRRNEVVFQGHLTHPSSVARHSKQLVEDLHKLSMNKKARVLKQQTNQAWEAPSQGKIKANWDASVDKASGKVGVGVVVRDWNSKVIATLRMEQELFPDPHMAEAYAALQAVMLCNSLGHRDVVLEGDSLLVVEGLKSQSNAPNYVGQIVADTKEILNTFSS
ncbi:uncharacterized protein LOC122319281 [Carya illinoinensis]|uniref:uncharacterized protein LOC122319281 n=1 Tax=Carya illinoinensis TaxID=32201 RepID=UPI001C71CCEC|nr:uncharacterized protein LOC122319281 [Carya illinoinensis]